MKTVTFYSYKGGVGRSLALANVATRLSEFGKKVCIVDFDIEAPGLHFKFKNNVNKFVINKGLVDYICDFRDSNKIPNSLKDYSTIIKFGSKKQQPITLIPAGNIESNDYWQKLSSIHWNEFFYNEDSKGVRFFLDFKERIHKEFNPDFILIDSRTGITEIAGITISLLADEVVIVAINNEENLFGSKKIMDSISKNENIIFEKIPKIHFVLSRLPYDPKLSSNKTKEDYIIETVKKKINLNDITVIHSYKRLEEYEQLLINEENIDVAQDYLKLFKILTEDILKPAELEKFEKIKKSDKLLNEALIERNTDKKIQLLIEAKNIYEYNYEAILVLIDEYIEKKEFSSAMKLLDKLSEIEDYYTIALEKKGYIHRTDDFLKDYNKSIEYYNTIIELNDTKNIKLAYFGLGYIYNELGQFHKSIEFYLKVVSLDPSDSYAYNNLSNTFRIIKDYDNALKYIEKAIDINSEHDVAFSTLAEIYSDLGKTFEFYLNLDLALSKKGNLKAYVGDTPEIYQKYIYDVKFIHLVNKYNFDYDEIKEIIEKAIKK